MTTAELAVLRWVGLSPAERDACEMGPPRWALNCVAGQLKNGQRVAKQIKKREEDIIALADDILKR